MKLSGIVVHGALAVSVPLLMLVYGCAGDSQYPDEGISFRMTSIEDDNCVNQTANCASIVIKYPQVLDNGSSMVARLESFMDQNIQKFLLEALPEHARISGGIPRKVKAFFGEHEYIVEKEQHGENSIWYIVMNVTTETSLDEYISFVYEVQWFHSEERGHKKYGFTLNASTADLVLVSEFTDDWQLLINQLASKMKGNFNNADIDQTLRNFIAKEEGFHFYFNSRERGPQDIFIPFDSLLSNR